MTPLPTQVAHYRITSKLGEGGMGAVYRATDTKLNREVAIKVLPEEYAQDADRMSRFAREAQVLAGLNHPNIAAIYGLEERSLVLEMVEGPDLAERIACGPIPLEEALPIARQLAEALEYAHERGIIHRDLKPANLKVTPEGKLKVLDFGLAKALASDGGTAASSNPMSSPTMTMRATVAGVIMGTAGYMSPEQAKGKPVDRRADIWAFGVVFAEMLTGEMMYTGETVSEMLASVIKDQPALDKLPEDTPPHIRRLLRRCLEKDPQRRLQAIGEARIAIDEAPQEAPTAPAPAPIPPSRRPGFLWLAGGVAAGIALAAGVTMWRAPKPENRALLRFNADMGPNGRVGLRTGAMLSPDGSRVAFPVSRGSARLLATRLMDQTTETVLAGTEDVADHFFSPDGQWLGFAAAGKLKKVSVQGGAPLTLCEVGGTRGATWNEDGYIYLSLNGAQLYRVPAAGGTPEIVSHPEHHGEQWHRYPQALPGGTSLLVTAMPSDKGREAVSDLASIAVLSLKTGLTRVVVKSGHVGRYVPGYLLYVSQNTLFAVKFDADRMEVKGEPVPMVPGVAAGETGGGALFDVARNGTMVYATELGTRSTLPVVWVDAGGTRPLIDSPPGRVATPRFSPDGRLLAAAVRRELWVFDPERGTSTRLTTKIDAQYPVWTPDGKYIAFAASLNGIGWVRADGSLPQQVIYQAPPGISAVPQSFTADGRQLLMHQGTTTDNNNREIYVLPVDATDPEHPKVGTPQVFVATETADVDPMLSPDGHWVAYATNVKRAGYQVFVRSFPPGAPGAQVQVSVLPGRFPMWSRTARELFYVTAEGQIQVVPYALNAQSFVPGKMRQWSNQTIQLNNVAYPIDIAPNGKSFAASLAATETAGKTNLHLTFLVNFLDELRRRLP